MINEPELLFVLKASWQNLSHSQSLHRFCLYFTINQFSDVSITGSGQGTIVLCKNCANGILEPRHYFTSKCKIKNICCLLIHCHKELFDSELLILKGLVDNNRNIFLDELTLEFSIKTGNYVHYSSIWRYITADLYYSLKVLSRAA